VQNIIHDENLLYVSDIKNKEKEESPVVLTKIVHKDPSTYKIIFSFSKSGPGVFYSHLTIIEVLSMAMVRAGLPVSYTEGFNPLPHLEIASPLAIGIAADNEIAAIETRGFLDGKEFMDSMNKVLPEGIIIKNAMNIFIPSGTKKHSLSSLVWGGLYQGKENSTVNDMVTFKDEKKYRLDRAEKEGSCYGMKRLAVLAIDSDDPARGAPYSEVFRKLYPI
jgi:radical SAM-linked protein